jgi:hypothetical protein
VTHVLPFGSGVWPALASSVVQCLLSHQPNYSGAACGRNWSYDNGTKSNGCCQNDQQFKNHINYTWCCNIHDGGTSNISENYYKQKKRVVVIQS